MNDDELASDVLRRLRKRSPPRSYTELREAIFGGLAMSRKTFWCNHEHGFYFRVRGYGLSFDMAMPVMFSERNGYRKVLRIGRLAIQWLTP